MRDSQQLQAADTRYTFSEL